MKYLIIILLLTLSSCNVTSKDFYTTEPVMTGILIGVLTNL